MTTEMTPAMRRSVLIATLRDKTLWPKGFEWNYASRSTCAIGLTEKLWPNIHIRIHWFTPCPEFGLSDGEVNQVFGGLYYTPPFMRDTPVTPEMVADRLEAIHRSL